MTGRGFPPPWTVDELEACFVVIGQRRGIAKSECDFVHILNADQMVVSLRGLFSGALWVERFDATIFLHDTQTGSGRESCC